MNPNSRNQLWSKWKIVVTPPRAFGAPAFLEVQENVARFVRKGFGSAGQMSIKRRRNQWIVEFLIDSQRHPHDQATMTYFGRSFTRFFREKFGEQTRVDVNAKLMAGARLDSKPPDQLIVIPSVIERVQ